MIAGSGNRMTQEIHRQSMLAQAIAETQISISTGKRVQRPSDDPVASTRIASISVAQADNGAWAANITLATSLSAQADGVARSMTDRLARAQELMVAGASGTASPSDRNAYATELRSIADELDTYQNAQSSIGQPLFSMGTAVQIRFDGSTVMAPVPSRAEVFDIGGTTVGQIVRTAANALQLGNAAQISTSQTDVATALDHVANMAADIGLRAARLDRLNELGATQAIDLAEERSGLEDTDLSTAIAQLNSQRLTLDAAQAAFARINRRTLFDILS